MGGGNSSPAPPSPHPPTHPLLDRPWRQFTWGHKEKHLEYVKQFQPEKDEVHHVRVLLYGPVHAGKSSFISSAISSVRGRVAIPAEASASKTDISHTKWFKTHRIPKSPGSYYPLVFNDIMGLEEETGRGVSENDVKLAMEGHVNESYKFNPASPMSEGDRGYNSSPSVNVRAHVLVCVISANTHEIKPSFLRKIKKIREMASERGIPQLAVLTKIDEACEETEKDLKNVYRSKHLKKKMEDISAAVGIPLSCMFPVKNYATEAELDGETDELILSALRRIIDAGNDFIASLEV